MQKTTIYLPEHLKRRVEETAKARGCSEADVIREAIDRHTERPRPKLPLFRSVAPILDYDEAMRGFGSD